MAERKSCAVPWFAFVALVAASASSALSATSPSHRITGALTMFSVRIIADINHVDFVGERGLLGGDVVRCIGEQVAAGFSFASVRVVVHFRNADVADASGVNERGRAHE